VTDVVLDASALMAFLHSEPGADKVAKVLSDAVISAVNFSEVLKKTVERGGSIDTVAAYIRGLSVAIIPFDEVKAAASAALYPQAKPHGMSFADRACLSLGVLRRVTVMTAERKMGLLSLPIKVMVIRNAH
jgi:PIN domain nuclease of toxin-antitoxin system